VPCDSRIEITVEFGQATDVRVLAEALEALGVEAVRVEGKVIVFRGGLYQDGKFTLNRYETTRAFPAAEVLKRAYTKAVVLKNADRFAWAAKAANAVLATAGFSRKW